MHSNGLLSDRALKNLLVNNNRFYVLIYVTKLGEYKRRVFSKKRELTLFRAKALSKYTRCYKLTIKSKFKP